MRIFDRFCQHAALSLLMEGEYHRCTQQNLKKLATEDDDSDDIMISSPHICLLHTFVCINTIDGINEQTATILYSNRHGSEVWEESSGPRWRAPPNGRRACCAIPC